jgi:hypothetical protein
MEASVTDMVTPSSPLLDLQIPRAFRWRYGRVRSTPARVPELGPQAVSKSRQGGELRPELGGQVVELFQASAEPWVSQRDECRIELVDLKSQISALRRERDELLAAAVALSPVVSDLQSKEQELVTLRSEIQALRKRKASLERPIAGPRGPTVMARLLRTENQRFDDS